MDLGQSNNTPQTVLDELIVRRGLSYEDAIAECEWLAQVAAQPYLGAADALRNELDPLRGS